MLKRIGLTFLTILAGPLAIVLTLPFYSWSATGGLLTAVIISASAVASILKGNREFNDHQKRVAKQSLFHGDSLPRRQRAAWVNAGTECEPSPATAGRRQAPEPSTLSEPTLLEAQELVNEYGAILEHSKTVTRSEAGLPGTKEQIKDALVDIARHARASGDSPQTLEALRVGYASLAQFVSERDAEAANTYHNLLSAGVAAERDYAKLRKLAPKVAEAGPGAVDVMCRSNEEFARLTAEFDDRVRE